MKRIWIVAGIAVVTGACFAQAAGIGGANLCYNGSFDSGEKPLDGWNYDYQWLNNQHYMKNHTRVSHVPSYKGRTSLLRINGTSAETKVESKPIPYEQDARYRCTLELGGNTMPHIYFAGYMWKPGVRPNDEPHLGDLRMIYKSQFRNHKITSAGSGWKRVTFEFPMQNPSSMAKKRLKHLRYFTIYIIVHDLAKGEAYIDNVNVTKIQ